MSRKPMLVVISILAFVLSNAAFAAQQDEQRGRNFTRGVAVHGMGQGYLGVQLTHLTPELRAHFGAPEDAGVMVSRVEKGGPAEAAGVRVGDIVTAIDGERVDGSRSLSRVVRRKDEGESVSLEIIRDGGIENLPVLIAARERSVIDLAGGYRSLPDGDSLPDHAVFFAGSDFHLDEESMEAFETAMRELEDRFDSTEWQERIERFQEMDFTVIQERMQEVEERLKNLEAELEKELGQK